MVVKAAWRSMVEEHTAEGASRADIVELPAALAVLELVVFGKLRQFANS